ncbi:MAG: 2-C-methyl-D-erythritol 4-phosphate cytidylyltransferase [Terriglobales bacterium]
MRVIVIIPAAGLGTRMAGSATGKAPAKQFTELNDVPVLIHTLRKFVAAPGVSEIVIALRKHEAETFAPRLKQENATKPVRIVEGGEHRQESVSNALSAITAAADDIVLVHDAVRPFVDREVIENVIEAATKHGAAIAAVPAVDTIKQVDRTAEGAVVNATIPREHIVLVQTPQGFRFSVLKQAFEEAIRDGFRGTDESSVVERMGHPVSVVMGSPRNIKITTPADLELAEFYAAQESKKYVTG